MRIVSLLPSATEILFAIGAGDDVVGVTHECDFPVDALALPKLTSSAIDARGAPGDIDRHVRRNVHAGSSLYHLDAELLALLAPDLIVTQELCAVCAVSYDAVDRAVKRLHGDARVVSLEPSSLEDVFATIGVVGDLTARPVEARALVSRLRNAFTELRAATQARPQRPRALLLEWTDPPMSAGHWIPELVEIAGATPVLADAGRDSRRLSWEEISVADPDAIVVAPCGFDIRKTNRAIEELDTVDTWRSLRAVRDGRVYAMDGNAYVSRPGPRLFESAELMATALGAPDASRR
ncbi:MAG: ABC transporter substrate-binding protein [Candidatus Eremiobacteraeota bacterium]|nr:ABC transporter substrate-binding protein [Candidatus Eremiobacteraeota bacterium]